MLEQETQIAVPCSRPHPRLVMNAANFNLMARVSFKSVSARGFTPTIFRRNAWHILGHTCTSTEANRTGVWPHDPNGAVPRGARTADACKRVSPVSLRSRSLGYEGRGKLQIQILCDADDNPRRRMNTARQ